MTEEARRLASKTQVDASLDIADKIQKNDKT